MRKPVLPLVAYLLLIAAAVWAALAIADAWQSRLLPTLQRAGGAADSPSKASAKEGWPVHRDGARGFSLRIPPDWQATTTTDAALAVGFTTADTGELIRRGRVNPRYPYALSVRVLPAVANHPSARGVEPPIATVADFSARVPTVAARGETTVDGERALRFIANDGHQFFGLLVPHGGKIYALHFERTWTDARFDASTVERAVLASFRFLR